MVVSIDLAVIPQSQIYPILMAMTVEEVKPDSLEFWMTRATEASDNGNANVALKILDDVPKQWRDSSPLWNSRGSILERAGRTNDALQAYSIAIALSERESNTNDQKTALRLRSKLLHKLGRIEEAAVDNCLRQDIPVRPIQTRRELIDLSAFYNSNLSLHLARKDESALAEFSSALESKTGVEFDIRGSVGVYGRGAEMEGLPPSPRSIVGIPIRQRASRLHIIQFAAWEELNATEIGSYIFHFANGQTEKIPIVYGENIREFNKSAPVPHAQILLFRATPRAKAMYLFKMTWDNPHPDLEITAFDLVSAGTKSVPRLLAITAD
jgi:tetratricopeptide (TPR) repeat protein